MNNIAKPMKINILLSALLLILLVPGCDIFNPQKTFRLAIPESDFSYYTSSQHLISFLEQGGFKVEMVPVKNAIEANRMVAQGNADLTFIMNHSDFIPNELSADAGKLRTIAPMFERLFFLFSRAPVSDTLNARELLEGKKIGIEVLGGETNANLSYLIKSGQIKNVEIVQKDQDPDFIHFWGTYYGPRATSLIENKWTEISLDPAWVNYIIFNEPSLNHFVLPAIPGIEGSKNLNTFSIQTLLVGSSKLGEKAVFELSSYIFQHKLELMSYDIMYRAINESNNVAKLLYPLHSGTDAYFRRAQPSFFERYAELIALVLSIGAISYGAFQALKNSIGRRRRERIDHYFMDFLDIRSQEVTKAEKAKLLDDLLQRALIQKVSEKLDKTDFHIFSRLLQQELANLR
jgi:TRAP-type uncharacterized transport system substrate-binding protein